MKIPIHKSPAIVAVETDSISFSGPVLSAEISLEKKTPYKSRQEAVADGATVVSQFPRDGLWILVIEFTGLPHKPGEQVRVVCKTFSRKTKLGDVEWAALRDRIHRARNRAASLYNQRTSPKPPPIVVANALREIFPEGPLTEPVWLAHIAEEVGSDSVWPTLRNLGVEEVRKFFQAESQITHRYSTHRAINWFLFTYWSKIAREELNAKKAHELATAILGENITGTLEAFQKYLTRQRIRLAPAHRKKSDKSTAKTRSAS